jgi:hypothetical protein
MVTRKIDLAIAELEKIIMPTTRIFNTVACISLGIMPLPIFLDVLLRTLSTKSVPGQIEISEYLLRTGCRPDKERAYHYRSADHEIPGTNKNCC